VEKLIFKPAISKREKEAGKDGRVGFRKYGDQVMTTPPYFYRVGSRFTDPSPYSAILGGPRSI
jgi:hypothetical protein